MDPRRLLPVLTAVACACVVATLVVAVMRPDAPKPRRPAAPGLVQGGPRAVLAAWDEARADAWASGDDDALAALYVDGSRTGAVDVRLQGDYLDRGLVVEGLTTQVLALDVVSRTPDRLVLVVTDRVVGGRAVGGATPVALPVDRASTRRVELVRVGDEWLVDEAREAGQPSAAASTSWTSSSSKS